MRKEIVASLSSLHTNAHTDLFSTEFSLWSTSKLMREDIAASPSSLHKKVNKQIMIQVENSRGHLLVANRACVTSDIIIVCTCIRCVWARAHVIVHVRAYARSYERVRLCVCIVLRAIVSFVNFCITVRSRTHTDSTGLIKQNILSRPISAEHFEYALICRHLTRTLTLWRCVVSGLHSGLAPRFTKKNAPMP